MLGVEVSACVDANGVRYVELTQTDYIERMYAEVSRFLKDGYKVTSPIAKDKAKSLISVNADGTVLKPPVHVYTKNLDNGYRTIIGMLMWVQRIPEWTFLLAWRIYVASCRALHRI